jgi:hypothetical protein
VPILPTKVGYQGSSGSYSDIVKLTRLTHLKFRSWHEHALSGGVANKDVRLGIEAYRERFARQE